MLQWFFRFSEFAKFSESSTSFGENPVPFALVMTTTMTTTMRSYNLTFLMTWKLSPSANQLIVVSSCQVRSAGARYEQITHSFLDGSGFLHKKPVYRSVWLPHQSINILRVFPYLLSVLKWISVSNSYTVDHSSTKRISSKYCATCCSLVY